MKAILVAFIYTTIFFGLIFVCFHKNFEELNSTVNLISVDTSKKIQKDTILDEENKVLISYPEYASRYASLKIESLNIEFPVYFGDSMSILRKGIGHSSGSYFPGEGGSIIYMGHNSVGYLNNLEKIKLSDEIVVETTYGTYKYEVYDTKIINYKEVDKLPIQDKEEILMLYTCHGAYHTPNRFVVYAKLIK